MRIATAILAPVAGFVFLAATAIAHSAPSATAEKPGPIVKEQIAPAKQDKAPRICLFSEQGKVVTPSKVASGAKPDKARATERKDAPPTRTQAGKRICDVDKAPSQRTSQG
jgi:hypothetical protein